MEPDVYTRDNNREVFSCARLIQSRPLHYIPTKNPLLYPQATKKVLQTLSFPSGYPT